MCEKLKGQVAIVTGAGRGIGRDIALTLAQHGAKVVIVSRTQSDLDGTLGGIRRSGGDCVAVCGDVSAPHTVDVLVKKTLDVYGCIDILINNAGGYPLEMYGGGKQPLKIWEWTGEQWDKIIESNLKTTFMCISKVLPQMIKQRGGTVVNMSSRMGRIASEMGAYAAAKAAVIALTKTAAIQAEPYGITVNAVSPGMLDTPGQRMYNESTGQADAAMGATKEVVDAVLYLLCRAPRGMTGQSLDLFKTV